MKTVKILNGRKEKVIEDYEEICPICEGRGCGLYNTSECNPSGDCYNCSYIEIPQCEACDMGIVTWIDNIMKGEK